MTTAPKKAVQETDVHPSASLSGSSAASDVRSAYSPPRIEKRRAVARVTLLSGGGMAMATGGVFGMM